jgi:hypothetical protein
MSIYDDRPPLWTAMCAAYAATPRPCHAAFYYAAEIRAIAKYLVPNTDADCIVPEHGQYLYDLLLAEADRAEAAE